MSDKHIENLTVTNFKCFKHLEVMDLGRVNLIGGKNNVGKTAFLEAVELFVSSDMPSHLAYLISGMLIRRQITNNTFQESIEIDFFYDAESKVDISSTDKTCTVERVSSTDNGLPVEVIKLSVNNDKIDLPIKHELFNKKSSLANSIYIPSSKLDEQFIAILLGKLIDIGMEYFLSNSLGLFDENILELKQIAKENHVTLKLKIKNKDKLVLLSSLGEGINRYIAILCAIWANKGGVLLIDEIENGIHYTNHKKLWEIIFQASVDANCQLFITSHSKECISAFNEVQFEIENCSSQYYEFYRNLKNDLITASALDKDQLRYELTHEGRVRGE
jgi:AAA15 family ATPase/GTPase